jgi:hypothetical protein
MYLSAEARAGYPPFRLADQAVVERGVAGLDEDLTSGKWHHGYGSLLEPASYEAGYRFLRTDLY